MVYGANDGVITTFAVVAGVIGGGLSARTMLIIGAANLFADGLSMGVGNYLSIRSNESALAAEGRPEEEASPARHGLATRSRSSSPGPCRWRRSPWDEFSVGQRVIVGAITPCGQCFYCLNTAHSQCGGALGGWRFGNTIDGAQAEYLLVPNAQANLAKIPNR